MNEFERLVTEASSLPVSGWDFSVLRDRWTRGAPPWSLRSIVRSSFKTNSAFLDLGTGGGEFLLSLSPLPKHVLVTEGYEPNLALARTRLEPLGIHVVPTGPNHRLDIPDASVDLVLARHESFDAREVARVLKRGGMFVTQQVCPDNYSELHSRFGVPPSRPYNRLESLKEFSDEVRGAGLTIRASKEARYQDAFQDVGALIYFLRAAPWEVPEFSVTRFRSVLEAIHAEIQEKGAWRLTAHRVLVTATLPE